MQFLHWRPNKKGCSESAGGFHCWHLKRDSGNGELDERVFRCHLCGKIEKVTFFHVEDRNVEQKDDAFTMLMEYENV